MSNYTKEYGYIRVSSKTQNEDRQIRTMKRIGIPRNRIYIDKVSGNIKSVENHNKNKKSSNCGIRYAVIRY